MKGSYAASVVFTLAVMLIATTEYSNGEGSGVPVILEYETERLSDQSHGGPGLIRYTFVPGMTRIEQEYLLLFVDYKDLHFYKHSIADKGCELYALHAPEKKVVKEVDVDKEIVREKAGKMGSMKIAWLEGGLEECGGYPCKQVRINWGWKAQVMRTMDSPKVTMYGFSFVPKKVDYKVTSSIDRIDDLFSLSAAYETIFKANPLLRQIDPLGVMRTIKGVPVQISSKEKTVSLRSVGRGDTRHGDMRLPDSCRLKKEMSSPDKSVDG